MGSRDRGPEPRGRNEIRTADPVLRSLFLEMHRLKIPASKLADQLGVTRVCISRWKKGMSNPSNINVVNMADQLGYDITITKREGQ